MASDASTSVPLNIAGYSIRKRIGGGAFASVYQGISTSPDSHGVHRTVAIKCIDMQSSSAEKVQSDCVISEITILKKLKHRNIVRLFDFQWDRKNIYLIMEYCGGGDLSCFIRYHGALKEKLVQRFMKQLAAALRYMRKMNVAHLDLKPQNILLTSPIQPLIKISDFGLSKFMKSYDMSSSFRGSPLYMAPEIFTRRSYDNRVDLWSSGVIMYECLYGHAPFSSDSYELLVEQIKSNESVKYPAEIQVSEPCMSLLEGLLVRNPHNRLSFDRFFYHPFIDLPTEDSLDKAKLEARQSQAEELHNNYASALKHLIKGIQLYIDYLNSIEENETSQRIREQIKILLEHGEMLKKRLKPRPEGKLEKIGDSKDPCITEWVDYPQVKAAFTIVNVAQQMELEEKWEDALAKYTIAIEGLLSILAKERGTARAINLQRRVTKWLYSAEHIKAYMEALDFENSLNGSSTLEDEADKQFRKLTGAIRPVALAGSAPCCIM